MEYNRDGDRFADGFEEGFSRARQIFWRDFTRRAMEFETIARDLESTGSSNAESYRVLAAGHRVAADLVQKSHTLYPGAVTQEDGEGDIWESGLFSH